MGGAGLRHVHVVGQYLFGLLGKDERAGLRHVNVAVNICLVCWGSMGGAGLRHAHVVG